VAYLALRNKWMTPYRTTLFAGVPYTCEGYGNKTEEGRYWSSSEDLSITISRGKLSAKAFYLCTVVIERCIFNNNRIPLFPCFTFIHHSRK